ncbi:MAG: acyltransferase [Paludibacteraceae bacterium]|nr:acyltransferase [Paludibacteraceae bacterium]
MATEELKRSKREPRYEFIRAAGILMVIICHISNEVGIPLTENGDKALQALVTTLASANAIFFMMSGMFALRFDESKQTYGNYYYKKMLYLIVPMLIYMGIESSAIVIVRHESLSTIPAFYFKNVFSDFAGKHYWFLYVLLGNLMFAPFLAKIFRGLSRKGMFIFIGIGFIYNFLIVYLPVIGRTSLWISPFSGQWHLYFIMGYCLNELIKDKKTKKYIIIAGIISWGIIQFLFFSGFPGCRDLSPFYGIYSCLAFIVLYSVYKSGNEWLDKIVLFLGKYSLSVFFLHFMMITFVSRYCTFLPTENFVARYLCMIVCVYVISLVLGVTIDNVIIKPIQKGINHLLTKKGS